MIGWCGDIDGYETSPGIIFLREVIFKLKLEEAGVVQAKEAGKGEEGFRPKQEHLKSSRTFDMLLLSKRQDVGYGRPLN